MVKKSNKEASKDFFKVLWQVALNYKKYAVLVPLFAGAFYGFKIWMNSPFWFLTEQQIFKQGEKIAQDFPDLKYYDIVSYNAFCQYDEFKFYMRFEPLNNRLKIERLCKQLNKYYNDLEINVKVRS